MRSQWWDEVNGLKGDDDYTNFFTRYTLENFLQGLLVNHIQAINTELRDGQGPPQAMWFERIKIEHVRLLEEGNLKNLTSYKRLLRNELKKQPQLSGLPLFASLQQEVAQAINKTKAANRENISARALTKAGQFGQHNQRKRKLEDGDGAAASTEQQVTTSAPAKFLR